MNISSFRKGVGVAAAAFAVSIGMSSAALAAPVFEVTPSALGGPSTPFSATQINGIMSTLVTYDPTANTSSGSGYIQFNGFGFNDTAVGAGTTGLTVNYDLYVTYNFTAKVIGSFGDVGWDTLTSLNYQVWGAGYNTTTFTPANAATNTVASAVNASAQLIGSGTLITGVTGFNDQGGAAVNSTNTYSNTDFGDTFFTAPVPFYNITFDSFNNTAQGLSRDATGNIVAVNQAIGNVDFNSAPVPEPVSLALLGVGLLGMSLASRRQKR